MLLRTSSWSWIAATLVAQAPAQAPEPPRTIPESSEHTATSRAADVERFVDACLGLACGDRLSARVAGKTHDGHGQLLVRVALPPRADQPTPPRLVALVIGNIHGGEVEGKEALQVLLREFASGEHTDVLEHVEAWFLPIYNVDGNEAAAAGNRRGQNGPEVVGSRPNGQGLDLNRDFVKADAPETRTLLRLFRELDPALFVDLHTTDGSYHGYHLTYAPSLCPNVDRELDRLCRGFLADAAAALRSGGFESFDYGNFETHDWDGSGAPESDGRGWFTYDHRARYGVNYFGLRNRLAVLSEAYSYADFATRIAATRAFVLQLLRQLAAQRDRIRAAFAAADGRTAAADAPVWFGSATAFGDPETLPVLIGAVDRVDGPDGRPLRFERRAETHPEVLPVVRRFRAHAWRRLPEAWAIVAPSPEVIAHLQWHGIEFAAVSAPSRRLAQRFAVEARRKPKRPYQGHQELVLEGHWEPPAEVALPLGTIVIPARQRLARLAATLLEPDSEDSLSSWNFFETATDAHYPVLRLPSP